MSVTSDAAVLEVFGDRPMTTHQIREALALKGGVEFDQVPIYRLRRTLDRLEARGDIVGSGGPKRVDLPDWPVTDGRDVQWAKAHVAEKIAQVHQERLDLQAEIDHEREALLRDLHRLLRPFEREALGLTGLPGRLKAFRENGDGLPSPSVMRRLGEDGALGWPMCVLRVVVEKVKAASGEGEDDG